MSPTTSADPAPSVPARLLLALDEAAAKLEKAERARSEPIAIIGMGCRFPGGARDASSCWNLLRGGVDTIRTVPMDRWDADEYYNRDPDIPGRICTRSGGFLDEVDRFDGAFFGVSPREAAAMDPQQRILLEVAHEALDCAGQLADRLLPNSTGVFVGLTNSDYAHLLKKSSAARPLDQYFVTGNSPNAAAGRISYLLGLRGPSLVVDSACSSSLVAVHLACQSLRAGECALALSGGVNLVLAPDASVALSRARMLSPDGRCKTFDAAADGYGRGEGCGVVVLKRLSDAQRDGDRVLALIRASTVNQDGPTGGFTVPSGAAQRSLLAAALAKAQLAGADIDYVEAHGTGTALGDPIEIGALADVYGVGRPVDRPLLVGSVKTNFGHLESAAGAAGLVKAVLALWHGEIPAHLNFRTPSRHIAWEEIAVRVAGELCPWPSTDRARRAGVSSFGVSGTNAHVILEAAPSDLAASALPAPRRSFRGERHWYKEPTTPLKRDDLLYGIEWKPFPRRERTFSPANFTRSAVYKDQMRAWLCEVRAQAGLGTYAEVLDSLEALACLYAHRALQTVSTSEVVPAHMRLFSRLEGLAAAAPSGDPTDPERMASGIRANCPAARVEVEMLARCGERLPDVLRGICDPLALLFPPGEEISAANLYSGTPCARMMNELVAAAVAGLCQKSPENKPLRVLEIGAGTGGTTSAVLPALAGAALEYVFTDVSPLFVASARRRFLGTPGVSCRVLDIERNPMAQGFAVGEFDIIIAANVLHATRDLRAALGHVRSLLATAGRLVLLEAVNPLGLLDIIFGMTEGWWRFADTELRPTHALLNLDRWRVALSGAGFADIDAFLNRRELGEIFAQQAVIVARAEGEAPTASRSASGSWLLVADRPEFAALVAARLKGGGGSCRVVASEPTDVLAATVRAGPWRGIVDLTSIDVVDPLGTRPLSTLLPLVQASLDQPTRVDFVTCGAVPANENDRVPGVAQSVVWGFARSLAQEHPELHPRRFDLDPTAALPDSANTLVVELLSPDDEDQIAWRGGARFVARLARAEIEPGAPQRLNGEATYLIVGGLGGLGRPLARRLVERGARHVVIASRHGNSAAESGSKSELAALGAEVRIVRADVASGADVARVFAEIAATPWPLRGIVHAAGVLDDGMVRSQAWDKMARVLAPKVAGAWNLHLQTQEMALDFFVLFSSATALLGSPGQANHAAANAFLDSLAFHRRARGLCALSVAWGAWGEIGAAAERGVGERFRAKGIGTLAPAEGWEKLERLMGSTSAYMAVLPVDWAKVDSELTASPFFRCLRIDPDPSAVTKLDNLACGTLALLPRAERLALLLGEIRRQVAHVLGLASAGEVDPDQGFFALGMDSLTSVELRNRLQATMGRTLPSTVAFDYPTSHALAAHLASEGEISGRDANAAKPPLPGIKNSMAQFDGLSAAELSALLDVELGKS